jgi:hypothetical protein
MTSPSEAARTLSRARWGTTKVDRLVHELAERREDLGTEQLAELRELIGTTKGRADDR